MVNTNAPPTSRITTLKNGEYPDYKFSTNYSVLANGSEKYAPVDPWGFVNVRIDWTKKYLNFTLAENQTRSIKSKVQIPTEPLPLSFKHWSTGDSSWMQGPPPHRSEANVAWVRAFFNSSQVTKAARKSFDARCHAEAKCNVDDLTLRGSTNYTTKALVQFKDPKRNEEWRIPAAIVTGASTFIGVITLMNVIFRRKPWLTMFNKKDAKDSYVEPILSSPSAIANPQKKHSLVIKSSRNPSAMKSGIDDHAIAELAASSSDSEDSDTDAVGDLPYIESYERKKSTRFSIPHTPGRETQASSRKSSRNPPKKSSLTFQHPFAPGEEVEDEEVEDEYERSQSKDFVTIGDRALSSGSDWRRKSRAYHGSFPDLHPKARAISNAQAAKYGSRKWSGAPEARRRSLFQSVGSVLWTGDENTTEFPEDEEGPAYVVIGADDKPTEAIEMSDWNTQPLHHIPTVDPYFNSNKPDRRPTLAEAVPVAAQDIPLPKAKANEVRVDYLAGLVAFSCIVVTIVHFMLTFLPYAGGLSEGLHYKSEIWARWSVEPLLLNPVWLGPLFVTSCRFLAGKYLRSGNLIDVGQKMLLRAPRMMIPCVIVATLQYFFIEEGLMAWLQWLPSISWSTWPYITDYKNFGYFLTDIIELAYVYPNAAPGVVPHYCVGILWSVPVQLQFSYTTLLAAVIVREIKTSWKRFAIYFFCIVNSWYALSWGSCFWAGVMLADLQLTYKMSKWIQARPSFLYPFCIIMWIIALASAFATMLEDRLGIHLISGEHDLHPDQYTGLPMLQTSSAGYPDYFEPRLNTTVFAIAIQILVETSTLFQAFLSMRVWRPIFPHAYTIYLTHGFVWWTLGSYTCVKLGELGIPYWANMLVTAIVSYTCLTFLVLAVSPLTEMTTSAACRNLERWAVQPPVPMKPTLSPFPKDLFLSRTGESDENADEEARRPSLRPHRQSGHTIPEDGEEKRRKPTLVTVHEMPSEGSLAASSSSSSR